MQQRISWLVLIVSTTGLASTVPAQTPPTSPDFSGTWSGTITIRDTIEVPFNFEIDAQGQLYFLNASERFQSENIRVQNDSLFMRFDQFNNELAFRIVSENELQGMFRRQNR